MNPKLFSFFLIGLSRNIALILKRVFQINENNFNNYTTTANNNTISSIIALANKGLKGQSLKIISIFSKLKFRIK